MLYEIRVYNRIVRFTILCDHVVVCFIILHVLYYIILHAVNLKNTTSLYVYMWVQTCGCTHVSATHVGATMLAQAFSVQKLYSTVETTEQRPIVPLAMPATKVLSCGHSALKRHY